MGALSINGVADLRAPFEPLVPGVFHVHNTARYHRPPDETEEQFTQFLLDDLEHTIDSEGPQTIAMVILEPVQNSGGALTPPPGYFQGVRELCDRYGILLCADEVITGFGRVGGWFGSSATTSARTSSPARRGSPLRMHRSARWSPRTR